MPTTRMIGRVYRHLFEKDREQLRKRMSAKARSATSGSGVIDLRTRMAKPVET